MDNAADPLKSKQVLIVEDDLNYRSLLRIRLEHAGMKVFTAASCKMAFSILRVEAIDLILLDIYLTDELSLELPVEIERQKPRYGTPKIIAMSGVMSVVQMRQVREEGKVGHFFQKPIEMDVLLAKVRELLSLPKQK